MGDGLRTMYVVSTDDSLVASTRAACEELEGWEVTQVQGLDELFAALPITGDVILLDGWLRGSNVYENCRKVTSETRSRTFAVTEHGNHMAEPIAKFCGATGVIQRPISASKLQAVLGGDPSPVPLPQDERDEHRDEEDVRLPEQLLVDLSGRPDESLVGALTDPETSLFNYPFLNYKLEEEFKRARRFHQPLSCVMLGFEGQASEECLRELASIFLLTSRDTDILGRFDESSFLFLLPNTSGNGAEIMAGRVAEQAELRGLTDLVGDPMVLSIGISTFPHPELRSREDLLGSAREAFLTARTQGGGVFTAA